MTSTVTHSRDAPSDGAPVESLLHANAPLLLYDGDCAFCGYWVRYWARLTGDRIRYRPYQEALAEYPELDAHTCRGAVQLQDEQGRWHGGAAASFRLLAHAGHGCHAALYARSRAFARASEAAYGAVAARRESAHFVARALWGEERHPARYTVAAGLFLRALALIYVAAFASLGVQVRGLYGGQGILPVHDFLRAARDALGPGAWFELPSIFWLADSDTALLAACIAGMLAGLCVLCGRLTVPALALAYALYLSLFTVGQDFMSFQWDLLLLEAGFLALFLPRHPAGASRLFRLLLFRFMFLSGTVKLISGDPSWASLTALDFHYFTQPLPTPLAWYAAQLPAWFDALCVAATFVVELALPWLIFAPRRPRMLAAGGFLTLEAVIFATGNYNFFNLLTMALCLFLFDDAQFGRDRHPAVARRPQRTPAKLGVMIVFGVLVLHNVYFVMRPFTQPPAVLTRLLSVFAPLRIANGYGLFAVMTTTRPEIEIEGSTDGRQWQAYAFRYKPGEPTRALGWNIPHQPRLDWQMWFAALSSAGETPWFSRFLLRLLENAPVVTALLAHNPFGDAPPRYVRAALYDYRFSSADVRRATGAVWSRTREGLYYPPVRLR